MTIMQFNFTQIDDNKYLSEQSVRAVLYLMLFTLIIM